MLYILMLHNPEVPTMDGETAIAAHLAIAEEARRGNAYVYSEALGGTDVTTTVRRGNGKPLRTDGPFAESKEIVGGFYVLDCQSADEAAEYATKMVATTDLAAVEIRPLLAVPGWPYEVAADRQRHAM
jgi:hypothetical protein